MLLVSEVLNIRTLTIIDRHYAFQEHFHGRKYTFYLDLRFLDFGLEILTYKKSHFCS